MADIFFLSRQLSRPLSAVLVFVCVGMIVSTPARSAPRSKDPVPTKAELLAQLKSIQTRQNNELQELDAGIRNRLKETTTVHLRGESPLVDRRITKLGGQIEDLVKRREEFSARRDFVSNLIFAFDTKWSGQPVQEFLEHTLLDMAMTEITDAKAGESRLWKFLTYASLAVREAPEPREDALLVLENYVSFANVLDPKTPALFAASRSYTGGSLSYSAKPVPRDQVGDLVEKELGEERSPGANKKGKADIELRLKATNSPPVHDDSGTQSATTSPAEIPARPQVNPLNGATIPPPPPAVPGQKY